MKEAKGKLYSWQDALNFDIRKVHDLYKKYVNPGQVELIGSFPFGRVLAEKAEGMHIYTTDGRKILDFTGGVGVLNHGHNHPRLLKARIEYQQQKRMEVHKNLLSQYIAALSHNIAQLLPEDLKISYFCNSGAEAVEDAVKLAYKYHGGKRKYILHSDISFHGKLLGAAGLTGSLELNFKFPTIPNIGKFEYNNIDTVKEAVKKLRRSDGDSDIYAIILEPFNATSLTGSTTGFLRELREICRRENIVLIFDEVFTGWAKTGELFHFMQHNVVPDILTYSKSFGGGKSSISGYTTRTHFFMKAYGTLNHAILHSTTYNGFGEETITAIEAINIIIEEDYVGKSKRIYNCLNPGLKKIQEKHPDMIEEIRGSGALNGVVCNKEISPVIRGALKLVPNEMFQDKRFAAKLITGSVICELFDKHHILTYYGDNWNVPLIISPSLIVTGEEIDYFLDALDQTLSVGKMKLLIKFVSQKFLNKK